VRPSARMSLRSQANNFSQKPQRRRQMGKVTIFTAADVVPTDPGRTKSRVVALWVRFRERFGISRQ
jgi:hypothetical protein